MQTMIQKWGNSQGIRLPKHILESVGLEIPATGKPVEVEVEVIAEEGKITIKKPLPSRKRRNIIELLAGYEGDYKASETDWGVPVGKEVW